MANFLHERADAKDLFRTLANEMNFPSVVVEKDYWITHCLWSLQKEGFQFEMKGGTSLSKGWNIIQRFSEDIDIRFEPPKGLNEKGLKPSQIKQRLDFFDDLASKIKISGCSVERITAYDDEDARNGGISLTYESYFDPIPGLKPMVLLEVGFTRTAPNEPKNISCWALDKALSVGLDVKNNGAVGVKCFNPEYTFVDKLQTICRRFRQHRDRNDPLKDLPRQFMRHYYDLFMLLDVERVKKFIGTPAYDEYKNEKLKGKDKEEFSSKTAFMISDPVVFSLFEAEFQSMESLLLSTDLAFKQVIEKIREYAKKF